MLLPVIALALVLIVAPAAADDPDFQAFMTASCQDPTDELAFRCGETFAGQGGVTGGSQTSLNPNQALASPNSASTYARERTQESRTRQDRRVDDDVAEQATMEFGRLGVLLNARAVDQSFDAGNDPTSERAYELSDRNVTLGIDYRLTPRSVVGAWVDWRDSELEFGRAPPVENLTPDFDAGRVDAESTGGVIFAGFDFSQAAYMDVAIGYSETDYELERRAVFEPVQAPGVAGSPTLVDTRGQTTGEDRWATMNLGYRVDAGSWSLDPFVGMTWSTVEVDAYTEDDLLDTGLAMQVSRVETQAFTGTLGFDARRVISLSSAVLIPQFHFDYNYAFEADVTTALASFIQDNDADNRLALSGDEPDRDFARAGVGLVAVFQGGWSMFVDVQTLIGAEHLDSYTVAVGIRLEH